MSFVIEVWTLTEPQQRIGLLEGSERINGNTIYCPKFNDGNRPKSEFFQILDVEGENRQKVLVESAEQAELYFKSRFTRT